MDLKPTDQHPFFTIITANYNKGSHVLETIASVCNQTFDSWEFLFIDDHSTDGSDALASSAVQADTRCFFLVNESGAKGANAARNHALARAKGRYIIFLDSDDLLSPDSLARRFTLAMNNPDLDFFILPMGLFFDQIGDSPLIVNVPSIESDLQRFLCRDIVWLITGPTWRIETLRTLGGFDLELHSQQDYDLHVRSLIAGFSYRYFHQIPDSFYRRNVASEPRKNSQSVEHFRHRKNMVLRHHELLLKANVLDDEYKRLLAIYLLDLAQMMRWHKVSLGRGNALHEALGFWHEAKRLNLLPARLYRIGKYYIRFKHELRIGRLPGVQRGMESFFHQQLRNYIFTPSKRYCQVTLDDYVE